MNGYLKIKTKIDNNGIDKDINELENKIKKLQEDNSKLSTEQSSLQNEIESYERLKQEADQYGNKIKELIKEKEAMVKANPDLAVTVDTPELANIKTQISEIQQKYIQTTNEIDRQTAKIDKVYVKLGKVKSKQTENNAKISQFKQKIDQINLNKFQTGFSSIGKSLQGQIKKIGKLAMAVIGVRTAWSMVRGIMNTVAQYNPQIATDLEYMKYAIANTMLPIVQKLVDLFYKLLSYANALTTAWFGINLFGNSSVKNFQKMKNYASGTAKAAKEIQKSLQGFDEMNILQDNSSSSVGSTGTGGNIPSLDLSNLDTEIPPWLQWIIEHKDEVITFFTTLGIIIGTIKIANFLSKFKTLTKFMGTLGKKILVIFKNLGLIKSIGIVVIITGVIALIKDLIKMISDPSWSNFGKILVDISVILAGIALLTGNWIIAVIALVTAIAGLTIQLFSQKGAILSVKDAEKNLQDATKDLEQANNSYIDSVDKAENTLKALREAEEKAGISGEELFKQVQQGTLDYRDMTKEQRQVYKAYLDNEKAQKELKEATYDLEQAKKKEKIASWESRLATMAETGQYNEFKKAVVEAFKRGELSAEEARDLIGKSMSGMSRDSQKTFMEDLPDDIKNGLNPKNYETAGQRIVKWFGELWKKIKSKFTEIGTAVGNAIGDAFKKVVNSIISFAENTINKFIRAINNVIGIINNTIPGVKINKFSTLNIPKLAKGGVISRPTTAIIGEAGKEAVMPLENNIEWIDLLADKLANKIGNNGGNYIVQLDGRTLQRGIAKRKQELAFATNGR